MNCPKVLQRTLGTGADAWHLHTPEKAKQCRRKTYHCGDFDINLFLTMRLPLRPQLGKVSSFDGDSDVSRRRTLNRRPAIVFCNQDLAA
jgi:hypothetical protein